MIDEAYFVLSDKVHYKNGRDSFLKDANRLIEESTGERKKKDPRLIYFLLGLLVALLPTICIVFLTRPLW